MELHPIPGNETPDGLSAGSIETPDGVTLRYAVTTAGHRGRGTVCIFNGRSEYIERWFETIDDLSARGFAVAVFEWRGQGLSDRLLTNPLKGYVESFEEYDTDLQCFMTDVVLPDCPPPYYALAHSTGGNILMRALRDRNWFNRAVMSAPLMGLSPMPAPRWIVKLIVRFVVSCGFGRMYLPGVAKTLKTAGGFPGNKYTSDVRRYTRDTNTLEEVPQLGIAGATFAWLNAVLASVDELSHMPKSGEPRTPVLIVAAGLDRVVSTEASRIFARRVPKVAAVVIDHSRHEILNERDEIREQFWAAFDTFIEDSEEPQDQLDIRARVSA